MHTPGELESAAPEFHAVPETSFQLLGKLLGRDMQLSQFRFALGQDSIDPAQHALGSERYLVR